MVTWVHPIIIDYTKLFMKILLWHTLWKNPSYATAANHCEREKSKRKNFILSNSRPYTSLKYVCMYDI
jgi:hypothetical protein